jgi:nitrite reductase/ring-hydroxylating ferredoxin subunit/multimeric flavodoxin WrbA
MLAARSPARRRSTCLRGEGARHRRIGVTGTRRWALACTRAELEAKGSTGVVVERTRLALFWLDGRPWAIGDACNHKAGPLSGGVLHGEYVMCPWHAWEYSVKTGRGPAPYDEEAVPSYAAELRGDEVWVDLAPATPRVLAPHPPHPLARPVVHEPHERPRVVGLSTTAMDRDNPRFSTSDHLLEHALAHAEAGLGAETRLLRLRELPFRECEGNYSKAARACTWPCAITERFADDQLTPVYEALVHWADVVLVATPIRWGAPSALYTKMVERMNCIQNQVTIANRVLIQRKVAAFVITGGQDNIQAVAGQMLTFFGELGFSFPPFPFIAHSRGWTAEDMERNVRAVRASDSLRAGARELVARAIDTARTLQAPAHFERGGRKAAPDTAPGSAADGATGGAASDAMAGATSDAMGGATSGAASDATGGAHGAATTGAPLPSGGAA